MSKRLKVSAVAFALALIGAVVTGAPVGQLYAQEETCTPEACTVAGEPGTCCMIGEDTMTCDPCGGFKAVQ